MLRKEQLKLMKAFAIKEGISTLMNYNNGKANGAHRRVQYGQDRLILKREKAVLARRIQTQANLRHIDALARSLGVMRTLTLPERKAKNWLRTWNRKQVEKASLARAPKPSPRWGLGKPDTDYTSDWIGSL